MRSLQIWLFLCHWSLFKVASAQQHVLHISPHNSPLTLTNNNGATLQISPQNQFRIDAKGLGIGREFYDSSELTLQLSVGGPIWTFYRKQGNSTADQSFVGETSSDDGAKVSCSLLRYMAEDAQGRSILTGVVQDMSTGLWYEIKPNAQGQDTVTIIRDEDIPESAPDHLIPTIPSELDDSDPEILSALAQVAKVWRSTSYLWNSVLPGSWGPLSTDETEEQSTVLDAMVLWTKDAECIKSTLPAGCEVNEDTKANMLAAMDLMTRDTNTAYSNSNIDLTVNIKHAERIHSYQEGTFPGALLWASTSPMVKNWRYEFEADVVLLVIDNSQMASVAGMAYNNYMTPGKRGWMFGVVAAQASNLRYVAAHELGHLFGCFHDRGTQSSCDSETTNWGHRDPDGAFTTIMAYRCKMDQCDGLEADSPCPRLPYFAGDVNYEGKTLGGTQNNCRGQILETKDLVANVMPRQDCFSPVATVQVLDKGTVTMEELQVGDLVLTSSGNYESVYMMDHVHPWRPTQYIQIHTWALHKPLEVSPNHLVFVEGQDFPIPALDVRVGDRMRLLTGFTKVIKLDLVFREGLYNPLTTDGTIVVDGVVASTYSAVWGSPHFEIGGWKVTSMQDLLHYLLTPMRAVAKRVPELLEREPGQEFHWYSLVGRDVAHWWENQSVFLQAFLFALPWIVYGSIQILVMLVWCCAAGLFVYEIEQMGAKRKHLQKQA